MPKTCFKCNITKSIGSFYKHSGMRDGTLNKCIDCTKIDTKKNREANIDKYRAYDRSRGNRQSSDYLKNYRAKYPNKRRAHNALNNAVRDGKIKRVSECSKCSSTDNVVAHHSDYLKPLDVVWLCQACHKQWHRDNGEGKNAR